MEAEHDSTPSPQPACGKRGTYYQPAETIVDVPGVDKGSPNETVDWYEGDAPSLIAAGLLEADMLPGQFGRPKNSATYRALGVERHATEHLCEVPGHMTIIRLTGDRYRVFRTVSRDEQRERSMKAGKHRRGDHPPVGDPVPPLQHTICTWRETWKGTKEQLRSIGIGANVAFPGDPGAPKRRVDTTDPLGFAVTITPCKWEDRGGLFEASCPFRSDRNYLYPKSQGEAYSPGVILNAGPGYFDNYVGTSEALVACGLVRLDQLPGQPSRFKQLCHYGPDGSYHRRGGWPPSSDAPGAVSIRREGKNRFLVQIRVSSEEAARRTVIVDPHRADEEAADYDAAQARLLARQAAERHAPAISTTAALIAEGRRRRLAPNVVCMFEMAEPAVIARAHRKAAVVVRSGNRAGPGPQVVAKVEARPGLLSADLLAALEALQEADRRKAENILRVRFDMPTLPPEAPCLWPAR